MLTDGQAQDLKQVMMMNGWKNIIMPTVLNRGREALKALCLNPVERKDKSPGEFKDKSDDQLRQIVEESERLATVWENELKVYDFNRRQDQERQNGDGATPDLSPSSLGAR